MNDQPTFASKAWSAEGKVTRRECFLAEMDAVLRCLRLLALIEPHHPKPVTAARITVRDWRGDIVRVMPLSLE